MCRTRKATQVSLPSSKSPPKQSKSVPSSSSFSSSSFTTSTSTTTNSSFSSTSIRASLRDDGPTLYSFDELSSAPAVPLSSSASRLTLRSQDVVLLRRPFLSNDPSGLPSRLSALCRSHHRSIARLLGASLAADHIYLIYKHIPGATLAHCLRNQRNPTFTPLRTWLSRIQLASDIANALEYIHHQSFTVHNCIKSSAIILTETDLTAKLCYFGAAELAREVLLDEEHDKTLKSDSRLMRIEGTRGYMAPEVLAGGRISQKSDVFAFGVVLLEIVSGDEPLRYVIGEDDFYSVSIVETARAAVEGEKVRAWVDARLMDSFPVDVVEKVLGVALRCVETEAETRPEMTWVTGRLSRLFLESKAWTEKIVVPTDISVSFAAR